MKSTTASYDACRLRDRDEKNDFVEGRWGYNFLRLEDFFMMQSYSLSSLEDRQLWAVL